MKRLILLIILSALLHLLLRSGIFTLADFVTELRTAPKLTEIELVEETNKSEEQIQKEKPIIKQLESQNPIINDDSMARFDSEKTQRVAKETKAQKIGLTQNASQKALAKNNHKIEKNNTDSGDLPEFTRMNVSNPNQVQNQQASISTILPNDIQFSDATNLNTDANTYYSFYNRVEELFYVRWAERLNYYWDRLAYDFKKNHLGGHVWSTVIEVWLKSSGEFHSAYIKQSSGYKPFDEATVFAFKDAKFFPNPPRAKVEADGFVRLRYRFNVHIGSLP